MLPRVHGEFPASEPQAAILPAPLINARFSALSLRIGTSSTLILPARPNRVYLLVQNQDTDVLYLNFDAPADADKGFQIAPFGYFEPLVATTSALHMLADNAYARCVIIEGTR